MPFAVLVILILLPVTVFAEIIGKPRTQRAVLRAHQDRSEPGREVVLFRDRGASGGVAKVETVTYSDLEPPLTN